MKIIYVTNDTLICINQGSNVSFGAFIMLNQIIMNKTASLFSGILGYDNLARKTTFIEKYYNVKIQKDLS